MTPTPDPSTLLSFEREALRIAISSVPEPARRNALEEQLRAVRVRSREYTGAGFYTYLDCPESLRSEALPDEANHRPPAFNMDFPDHTGALFFLVYTKDGLLDVLEGASSGMWYEDAASAGCWPGTTEPIVFDPALIELG